MNPMIRSHSAAVVPALPSGTTAASTTSIYPRAWACWAAATTTHAWRTP
ncbi:hypothetical protein ACQP2T_13375 [Nonomuraea sp. CA-143628]